MSDLEIVTQTLRDAGKQLGGVADQFTSELQSLQSELASLGEPWGQDDIGMLIGIAYQEVVSFALEVFFGALDEMRESGSDLGRIADMYDAVEKEIGDVFKRLGESLSGR